MLNNVDATTWNTQGEMGYWLGIGFGSTMMDGSDIVICQFKNTGQASDKFMCTDRKSNGYSTPALDEVDNVDDVDTVATFRTVGSKKLVDLSVTFDRLVDTSDTTGDQRLKLDNTGDAIYAHGSIISS